MGLEVRDISIREFDIGDKLYFVRIDHKNETGCDNYDIVEVEIIDWGMRCDIDRFGTQSNARYYYTLRYSDGRRDETADNDYQINRLHRTWKAAHEYILSQLSKTWNEINELVSYETRRQGFIGDEFAKWRLTRQSD